MDSQADDTEPEDADETVEPAADEPGPAVPAVFEGSAAFRIFECRFGADGVVGHRERERLPNEVFGRSTAVRFLRYEAKKLPPDLGLILVNSRGRVVAVASGETGSLKPTLVRSARKMLSESFGISRPPRRTSRPSGGPRRTSRPTRAR